MERIQVNVTTGERQVIQLIPEEIAQAQAQAAEHEASITYAQRRAMEYPSIPDQLDTLYHGGYDAWKTAIKAIKDKYPKD